MRWSQPDRGPEPRERVACRSVRGRRGVLSVTGERRLVGALGGELDDLRIRALATPVHDLAVLHEVGRRDDALVLAAAGLGLRRPVDELRAVEALRVVDA